MWAGEVNDEGLQVGELVSDRLHQDALPDDMSSREMPLPVGGDVNPSLLLVDKVPGQESHGLLGLFHPDRD